MPGNSDTHGAGVGASVTSHGDSSHSISWHRSERTPDTNFSLLEVPTAEDMELLDESRSPLDVVLSFILNIWTRLRLDKEKLIAGSFEQLIYAIFFH